MPVTRRIGVRPFAFDLLLVNGEDVRAPQLLERKRRLLRIMPKIESRLLFLDHLSERGRDLYRVACARDLEGIVGKWAGGPYQADGRGTSWVKIKTLSTHRSSTVTNSSKHLTDVGSC